MRINQLNERKIKDKKTWVKNIRFKNTFLIIFLQDRFYPDVEFNDWKKKRKNDLSNQYKSPRGFLVGGFYIVNFF